VGRKIRISEVVRLYPQRILAIYIRLINHNPERLMAIRRLAKEVEAAGTLFLLAQDTQDMAWHAIQQGWIPAINNQSSIVSKQ
jgi:phosphatidate phosphatase APP1